MAQQKSAQLCFNTVTASTYSVDFGTITGEQVITPYAPTIGLLETLAPTTIGPVDPSAVTVADNSDTQLLVFDLTATGLVTESFTCSISENKEQIACSVIKNDSTTGTKAVGLALGVRKK